MTLYGKSYTRLSCGCFSHFDACMDHSGTAWQIRTAAEVVRSSLALSSGDQLDKAWLLSLSVRQL